MRTITSDDGKTWDVAVQQASYGAHYLLFASRGGDEVRRTLMSASSQIDAELELAGLSDAQLKETLKALESSGTDEMDSYWG